MSAWAWAGRGTSSCWIGRAHDDAGSLCTQPAAAAAQHTTKPPMPMPIHTSAHAHAHAHARPAYAYPPRTSAPKPLLAHPRCAIHVTCDMACSTLPSPTHGALRNCTAFHNPSARLQPRRMGAELMHTKWENYPLPSHVWMCLCVFPSSASHPLLVCVCVCVCLHLSHAYIASHNILQAQPVFLPHRIASRRLVASQPLPKARAPRRLAPRNAGTGAT